MLDVFAPAPIVDLLELFDPLTAARPTRLKVALYQATYSDTVGFAEPGGPLLAVIGFLPLAAETAGEELTELWFVCRPEIAAHLFGFIKLARLTLARVAESGRSKIRAHVRAGHRPGQRLAGLVGLSCIGIEHGFETWEWRA